MRLHQLFHQHLAATGEKIHLARVNVIQVLGHHAHLFRLQVIDDESRIAFTDVDRREATQHGAAAKHLRFHVLAPRTRLQQIIDQYLHGVSAIAHRRGNRAIRITAAVGQHEVIHAAQARDTVADAGRDAGAEHGDDQHVLVGKVILTRQDLGGVTIERPVVIDVSGKLLFGFQAHISLSCTMRRCLGRGAPRLIELIDCFTAQLQ